MVRSARDHPDRRLRSPIATALSAFAATIVVMAAAIQIIIGWPQVLDSFGGGPSLTADRGSADRAGAASTPTAPPETSPASPSGTASSLTPSPPASPVPSTYVADLATWPVAGEWKSLGQSLLFGGQYTDEITLAPFDPPGADYIVQAQIQVTHPDQAANSISYLSFGLIARATNDGQYYAGWGGGQLFIGTSDGYSAFGTTGFVTTASPIDGAWHTFRLVVTGNQLQLSRDGQAISTVDNRFLSPGRVGLWASTEVSVRDFMVTTTSR